MANNTIQAAPVLAVLCIAAGVAGGSAVLAQAAPQPQHVVVNPTLLAGPSAEQAAAAYPLRAVGKGVAGHVRLHCTVLKTGDLTACSVVEEIPAGYGFGDAALTLEPSLKLTPRMVDGVAADSTTIIPLGFSASTSLLQSTLKTFPTENASVPCDSLHGRQDQFYPEAAQRTKAEGTARVACRISAESKPVECTWTEETPPNLGFGPAAAHLACMTRIKPSVTVPAEGAIITLPIRFKVPSP